MTMVYLRFFTLPLHDVADMLNLPNDKRFIAAAIASIVSYQSLLIYILFLQYTVFIRIL